MNAVLQCLIHLPDSLNTRFITKSYEQELKVKSGSMTKQYSRLLRHVIQNDQRHKSDMQTSNEQVEIRFSEGQATMQKNQKQNFVSTSELRKTLVRRVPQFNNFDQQDAHEFLSLMFEHVSTEMNRTGGRVPQSNVIKEKLSFREQADLHWKDSLAREDSIVQDFFQGQTMTLLTCEHCKGQ